LFELCVFDLDGTLVNSIKDLAASTDYALSKNGFPKNPLESYRYFVGDGVPMLIKRALKDNDSPEAEKAVHADFDAYYNKHYADNTQPYAGITELLTVLQQRGIKCAVLSNKPDNFVKIIVSKMFSDFKFSWVQGKADGFPKKPDPTALNFIIRSLGVKKENTLYVGDSNVDIFTGKNAQVQSCGVLWGFRDRDELEKAGAVSIVSKPEEILSLL